MFKYKIKVVGWEYHIYRKKHSLALWQDTGLSFTSKTDAECFVNYMNKLAKESPWLSM